MSKRFILYLTIVILAGLAVLWTSGFPQAPLEIIGVISFALMGLLFESLSIEVPSSQLTVSVSFVPILTSLLVFGAPASTWVAALSSLNWRELRGGKPMYRNLFNFCQMAISAAFASMVYRSLGGAPGVVVLGNPVPLLATIVAYMVVNATLPTFAYALYSSARVHATFIRLVAWSVPGFLATAPLGILAALVFETAGYVGVFLFVLPLILARMSFKLYRDMRQNYVETIQSLAEAIDAKDHYTRGHSERVGFYAVEIARKLGWNQIKLDQLYFLALLHDIGKIGVREDVLNKRGRLTEEERQAVNRHPELGATIVEKVGFLRKDAGSVRHHHEHYSGVGYPDRLAGDNIPLGARIIAVADAFDAMTSLRVYHPARSAVEALEELQKCSGVQFDPQVVEAFKTLMHERTDILTTAREAATAEWSALAGASH